MKKIDFFYLTQFYSSILQKNSKKQATLVGQGKLQPKAPENSIDLFRQLVEYCCQFETTDRPSFQQICTKMQQYYDENLEKIEVSQTNPNNSQQSLTTIDRNLTNTNMLQYNSLQPQSQTNSEQTYNSLQPQSQTNSNNFNES